MKSKVNSYRPILLVTISTLILIAAFRNSLTWHLQNFWGASGDFWQLQWNKLLNVIGEDYRSLWIYGSNFLGISIFWILGTIYTTIDLTNKPDALRRYKIQPGTNEPVETKRLIKAMAQILFNQFIMGISLTYLLYPLFEWRGIQPLRQLPTFHWVLFEIFIYILVEEVGFYYSHRMLHHRLIYKYIHKQHHEWTAPIAITAIYCHPIEHIFSNIIPILIGPFIMGSHIATTWLWYTLAIISTMNDHSGYHLPFLTSPEFHDYHHLKFTQCFGVIGILDWFHGTDEGFRKSKQFQRHKIITKLKSAREIFPDQ